MLKSASVGPFPYHLYTRRRDKLYQPMEMAPGDVYFRPVYRCASHMSTGKDLEDVERSRKKDSAHPVVVSDLFFNAAHQDAVCLPAVAPGLYEDLFDEYDNTIGCKKVSKPVELVADLFSFLFTSPEVRRMGSISYPDEQPEPIEILEERDARFRAYLKARSD